MKLIYSKDKPRDCRDCKFWDETKRCCGLKGECYYATGVADRSPCYACSYSKNGPCIGFCTKDLLGQRGVKAWQKELLKSKS